MLPWIEHQSAAAQVNGPSRFGHCSRRNTVKDCLSVSVCDNQLSFTEYLQMVREEALLDPERINQSSNMGWLLHQIFHYSKPSPVG